MPLSRSRRRDQSDSRAELDRDGHPRWLPTRRLARPVLAGTLFILPAATIVLTLAWAYVKFGSDTGRRSTALRHQAGGDRRRAQALWGLGRTALQGPLLFGIGVAAAVLYLARLQRAGNPLRQGFVVLLVRRPYRPVATAARRRMHALFAGLPLTMLPTLLQTAAVPVSLTTLFLTFLKIGAVLYGSGYVLLAFLRNDFVERLGWLTDQQLLDAVAIGQLTPGPVFTTATFIGYLVAGVPGAVLATVGSSCPRSSSSPCSTHWCRAFEVTLGRRPCSTASTPPPWD